MKHVQQGVHLTKEMQPLLPPSEPVPGVYNPTLPRIQPSPHHLSFKVQTSYFTRLNLCFVVLHLFIYLYNY